MTEETDRGWYLETENDKGDRQRREKEERGRTDIADKHVLLRSQVGPFFHYTVAFFSCRQKRQKNKTDCEDR